MKLNPSERKILYCCPLANQEDLAHELKLLKSLGYHAVLVESPESAMKKLRENASQFDTIVLHPEGFVVQEPEFFVREGWPGRWNQPYVMGYRFAWKLREHFPALPLVVRHRRDMIETIDSLRKADSLHSATEMRLVSLDAGVGRLRLMLS